MKQSQSRYGKASSVVAISEGINAVQPWYSRLSRHLSSHWDEQQRVVVLGNRDKGSNTSAVRFQASRATLYVQVHVQHDGSGGGGVDYSAGTSVSSNRRDMRANRQRDETVTRNGSDHYYMWLIPVFMNADGTYTKFDGEGTTLDQMAFVDLGT